MKSAILILALLASVASGQTVIQRLATNSTLPPFGSANLGPVNNIGQTSHQITIILRNNGANTCNFATFAQAYLYGSTSSTPSTAIQFATPVSVTTNSNGIAVQQASGLFPYVFVFVSLTDNVNCAVDVIYSGALASFFFEPLTVTRSTITPTSIANGAVIAEKSARRTASVVAGSGVAASSTLTPGATAAAVVDCLTFGVQATADLAAASATTVALTEGGPTIVWRQQVGLANGTLQATTSTHSVCGLGIIVGAGDTLTVAFAAGLTNVQETLSYTYYLLSTSN